MNNGMRTLCGLPDKTNRRRLLAAGALAVLSALCSLLPMLGLYVILDALLSNPRDVSQAYMGAGLSVGGIFLQVVFHFLSTRLSHLTAFETLHTVRSDILRKFARVPQGFLDENPAGKLKSRIFDDVEKLEMFYGHHYPEILGNLIVPVGMIAVVFCMDWRVGLVMLLPIVIYMSCIGVMGKLAMKNFPVMDSSTQKLNSSLVEYVHGMKEIRIFAAEGKSWSRFEESARSYCGFMKRWFAECRHSMTVNSVIMSSGIVFVFPAAGYLYATGRIDAPSLLFYLFASLCYVAPLTKIGRYGDEMNICMQIAGRLAELLDMRELPQEEASSVPERFDVVFDNVSFGYGEKKVFDGLSFTAEAGKVTALVGPSGGGKSTIARLIARFWDVKGGSIRIGGVDIRSMTAEQLASTIAFVTQNNTVFEQSVIDNIRLGKPDATFEEVTEAAKAARCHDFIMALPQGYETMLGRGCPLSGGERQRIAIARALLKNAPVLILDEATAYCDPDNEDELQKALSALARGKTVVVIAHRLLSVADADTIMVIRNGELAASGSHADLLTASPVYRNMWEAFERSENWLAGGEDHD